MIDKIVKIISFLIVACATVHSAQDVEFKDAIKTTHTSKLHIKNIIPFVTDNQEFCEAKNLWESTSSAIVFEKNKKKRIEKHQLGREKLTKIAFSPCHASNFSALEILFSSEFIEDQKSVLTEIETIAENHENKNSYEAIKLLWENEKYSEKAASIIEKLVKNKPSSQDTFKKVKLLRISYFSIFYPPNWKYIGKQPELLDFIYDNTTDKKLKNDITEESDENCFLFFVK